MSQQKMKFISIKNNLNKCANKNSSTENKKINCSANEKQIINVSGPNY